MRLVSWLIRHPTAAPLLTAITILCGGVAFQTLHLEEYPHVETYEIKVVVEHDGASAVDVEQNICSRIDIPLIALRGVKDVTSVAITGRCTTKIRLLEDVNLPDALANIRSVVSEIDELPIGSRKPIVTHVQEESRVATIIVSSDPNIRVVDLYQTARSLEDKLQSFPEISKTRLDYDRNDELRIEVPRMLLGSNRLTLDDISTAVSKYSVDVPIGVIEDAHAVSDIMISKKVRTVESLENLPIRTDSGFSHIRLSDVAEVSKTLSKSNTTAQFNGLNSVAIQVFRVGEEDLLEQALVLRDFVSSSKTRLGRDFDLHIWIDESIELREKTKTLLQSAIVGFILIITVLFLALDLRVATHVAFSMVVVLVGAFSLFPLLNLSISTLVIIAIVLMIGIIVDDSVVIAENIYSTNQRVADGQKIEHSIQRVLKPVFFGVLTSIVVFIPFLLVPGRLGAFFAVIGATAIVLLVMSLYECFLLLPHHISHTLNRSVLVTTSGITKTIGGMRTALGIGLQQVFLMTLKSFLKHPSKVITIYALSILLVVAYLGSGRVGFAFFPEITTNIVTGTVIFTDGTSIDSTKVALESLVEAAQSVGSLEHQEMQPFRVANIFVSTGLQDTSSGPLDTLLSGDHVGEVRVELDKDGLTKRKVEAFAMAWKSAWDGDATPNVVFTTNEAVTQGMYSILLTSDSPTELARSLATLEKSLQSIPTVENITNTMRSKKTDYLIELRSSAVDAGLTHFDLGRQLQAYFSGLELQTNHQNKKEVRTMLWLKQRTAQKRNREVLGDSLIQLPDRRWVPLGSVASISTLQGSSHITRFNGDRVGSISFSINSPTPNLIYEDITSEVVPDVLSTNPGVIQLTSLQSQEQSGAMGALLTSTVAAIAIIYSLLAIPLRSYWLPMTILITLPGCVAGSILGHLVFGLPLTAFSILGIITMCGVAVNGSLVLVSQVGTQYKSSHYKAKLILVCQQRMRPILLSALTTGIGLMPLLFTTKPELTYFVPVCISMVFGIVFSIPVNLLTLPTLLYLRYRSFR